MKPASQFTAKFQKQADRFHYARHDDLGQLGDFWIWTLTNFCKKNARRFWSLRPNTVRAMCACLVRWHVMRRTNKAISICWWKPRNIPVRGFQWALFKTSKTYLAGK